MAGKDEELSAPMEHESKSLGSEAMGACGLKRKAEQTEEAPAVDVVAVGLPDSSKQVVRFRLEPKDEEYMGYDSDSDDFDSDEEPEISFAKIKAKFEAHMRELEALFPDQTYAECFLDEEDSHGDDKESKTSSAT